VSSVNLLDWKARSSTFDGMAAFVPNVASMVMSTADRGAQTVPRPWVSSGIFNVLGVRPVVGRTFRPSDDAESAPLVILSEGFWRSRFNADPTIVGGILRLAAAPGAPGGVAPGCA